jgi:hypothetical protein
LQLRKLPGKIRRRTDSIPIPGIAVIGMLSLSLPPFSPAKVCLSPRRSGKTDGVKSSVNHFTSP